MPAKFEKKTTGKTQNSKDNKPEKSTSGIHDGHRDRLRDKFISGGADSLRPHELLEMLLFYSVPRKDTNETAHRLIEHFGSYAGVLDAPAEQLAMVDGVSKNSAILIKMIIPMYNEYRKESGKAPKILGPDSCGDYLVDYYTGKTDEEVTAVFVDASRRILGIESICRGDASNVVVNFRKLVNMVAKYPLSVSIVIAHNHPGGVALPSRDDISTTGELSKILSAIGIVLLDHIIVAGNDYVSMADTDGFRYLFK